MPALTAALRKDYETKWKSCEVDHQKPTVMAVAKRILAVKQTCAGFWNVPWWFVALCWLRESNLNPKRSLAQGDPWDQVSTHVPKGRGPFPSWRAAADDALKLKGYDKIANWDVATVLYLFEGFNGYGYRNKGVPSPYLWSHTNHYADGSWDDDPKGGKYYADHKWSADIYDSQIGVCAVLKCLIELDPTIRFGAQVPTPSPKPTTPPAPTNTARNVGIGGMIAAAFVGVVVFFRDHPVEIVIGTAACIGLYAFIRHKLKKP